MSVQAYIVDCSFLMTGFSRWKSVADWGMVAAVDSPRNTLIRLSDMMYFWMTEDGTLPPRLIETKFGVIPIQLP